MDSITIPSYDSSTGAGTLSSIASQHGVSVQDLMAANKGNTAAIPDGNNPNVIIAGAKLNIPKASVIQTTTSARADTQDRQARLAQITGSQGTNSANGPAAPQGGAPGALSFDSSVPLPQPGSQEYNDAAGGKIPKGYSMNANGRLTQDTGSQGGAAAGGDKSGAGAAPVDEMAGLKGEMEKIHAAGLAQIEGMKGTLQNLMMTGDARTASRIAMLMGMYQQRISAVQESYKRLGAAKDMADFRNGVNRYTPQQGQGVLTDNEVQEQLAITKVMSQMNDAITKAQQAQDANDMKTFNTEFDKIDKYQKTVDDSISKLMKSATDYQNAQTKATAAAAKGTAASVKTGMDLSKRVAPMVADSISSLKSDKEKKAAIEKYAKENGIDPAVLSGDVAAYTGAGKPPKPVKAAAGSKVKPIVSGGLSYTNDDLGQMETIFSKGATVDGTKFNPRGADGYVDPGLYKAMADKWTASGGLVKDFTSKFPPNKYVNPASNDTLPTYLQNSGGKKKPASVDATINALGK